MKSKTTTAIVLGQKKFGENDKLVFLYTKDFGKLMTVVRGARKMTSKFTGHLETLNSCDVTLYFGPGNILITEILSSKSLLKDDTNFLQLKTGIQIAEVTNRLLEENHAIDGLSNLLETSIMQLKKTEKPEIVLTCYIIKLLDMLGLMPEFNTGTRFKMEEKYVKYFNYAKLNPMHMLDNINLKTEETQFITKILKDYIEEEVNKKIIHL